jgi:leucine dehydrogenase
LSTVTQAAAVDAAQGRREIFCHDESVGLQGVIAIDDTTLGPGLGGVRFKPYPSIAHGIRECRRLAAAMTLKNAVAELPFGGAKSVILNAPPVPDRAALMRRFGDFVAQADGDYLPGVDMGTTVHDLALIGESGCTVSCSQEDPSRWTAAGVGAAIRAAVAPSSTGTVDGARVLIQGAGHVGAALATDLAREGASVLIADVDIERARELAARIGAATVDPGRVIGTPCDVYAPCAVAGVLDPRTISQLDCRIVAGAANDTLSDPRDAELLASRGVTYVPDFVANAGGVVDIHALRSGWDEERVTEEVLRIGDRVTQLLQEADSSGQTPLAVAEAMAVRNLARAQGLSA